VLVSSRTDNVFDFNLADDLTGAFDEIEEHLREMHIVKHNLDLQVFLTTFMDLKSLNIFLKQL
jgi:hypothetical protein